MLLALDQPTMRMDMVMIRLVMVIVVCMTSVLVSAGSRVASLLRTPRPIIIGALESHVSADNFCDHGGPRGAAGCRVAGFTLEEGLAHLLILSLGCVCVDDHNIDEPNSGCKSYLAT